MKILLPFLLLLTVIAPTQAQTKKRPFSVDLGFNRTARIDSFKELERRQFNFALTLSVPFKKHFAFIAAINESLEFRKPGVRFGVAVRLY